MLNTSQSTPSDRQRQRAKATPDVSRLESVKAAFATAGITVTGWARANGFKRQTVVDVMHGRTAGKYGEAHRVAVALGLKKGRVVDVKLFRPGP